MQHIVTLNRTFTCYMNCFHKHCVSTRSEKSKAEREGGERAIEWVSEWSKGGKREGGVTEIAGFQFGLDAEALHNNSPS